MSINDLKSGLVSVADAIRSKTGSSASLKIEDMPAAIQSIETGSGGSSEIQWPPDDYETGTDEYILVDTTLWDDDTEFSMNVGDVDTINWGDGTITSGTDTDYVIYTHTYEPGEYIIKISYKGSGVRGFETFTSQGPNGTTNDLGAFGQYTASTITGVERANHYVRKLILKTQAASTTDTFRCNLMLDEVRFVKCNSNLLSFAYCYNLHKVYIDDSVGVLPTNFMDYCTNLNEITLPKVSRINNYAFRWTGLKKFSIGSDSYTVGNYAFAYTKLTELDLSKATSLGTNICIGCRYLKEVTLPNLTSIGNSAFYYCESFEKFILPSSYTSIAANAFYHCDGIEHFVILNDSAVVSLANANAFSDTTCNFYVPVDLVDSYKNATNWITYADRIFPLSECPADVYSAGSED